MPTKYSKDIRKAHKKINRFIESNFYLEKIKESKIKKNNYLSKKLLEEVEACKLHWEKSFTKLDDLTKKEIWQHFIVDFAFNTASIEGNTITLEQAQKLLIENLSPKDKTLREIYDLQNTEKVFLDMLNTNHKITSKFISDIHDKLLENIDDRKGYRTQDVRVFKSNFESTSADYVLIDINLLIKWYNTNQKKLHPLVLAVIFHHKFEKIHPFMDGNGRTGRMILNYILLKNSYPPLIIRNKFRSEYLDELNEADKADLINIDIKYYNGLVGFSAIELIDNYWNIFL